MLNQQRTFPAKLMQSSQVIHEELHNTLCQAIALLKIAMCIHRENNHQLAKQLPRYVDTMSLLALQLDRLMRKLYD